MWKQQKFAPVLSIQCVGVQVYMAETLMQRWNNMRSVLKVPQVRISSLHGLLSHPYAMCHLPFHQSFGLENNFLTPFLQIPF